MAEITVERSDDPEDRLSFACRCSDKSTATCDEVTGWAWDYLRGTWKDRTALRAGRPDFVGAVVSTLAWKYRISISDIASDMWFGIHATSYGSGEERGVAFNEFIQCDDVEDGLAFVLRKAYEQFGDKRS